MSDSQIFRTIKLFLSLISADYLNNERPWNSHCGRDFNGHVGNYSIGSHGGHGDSNFGSRNEEKTKLLEFCGANDLLICNSSLGILSVI